MPGFLYYLPGEARKLTREELDEVGLTYAFDRNPTSNGCRAGPGGKSGMVLASGDTKVGYYPDQQTWKRIPGNKADAWVGIYADSPPGPDDLARDKQLDGHLVELSDGHKWLIPKARQWIEEDGELRWQHTLPQRLARNEQGHWVPCGPVDKYARLAEIVNLWGPSQELSYDDAISCGLDILRANYTGLGFDEVELLSLFDTDCLRVILGALMDQPTWEDRLKKKQADLALTSDGANTSDGETDSTPDTDQP